MRLIRSYLLILLLFPVSLSAQTDSLSLDSIRTAGRILFNNSDCIEIVQLEPYYYFKKISTSPFGIRKKVRYFSMESVIHCYSKEDTLECTLDTTHIGNHFRINSGDYDTLYNLLFSYPMSNTFSACYNPRHGIVFYDSEGLRIGFLEICLECSKIYSFPGTPSIIPVHKAFLELKIFIDSYTNKPATK